MTGSLLWLARLPNRLVGRVFIGGLVGVAVAIGPLTGKRSIGMALPGSSN